MDDLASENHFIDTVVKNEKEPNLEISNKFGIINIENKIIKPGVVMNKQPYLKPAYDMVHANKEQSREELPAIIYTQSSFYTEDTRRIFDNENCRDWTILDVLMRNSIT